MFPVFPSFGSTRKSINMILKQYAHLMRKGINVILKEDDYEFTCFYKDDYDMIGYSKNTSTENVVFNFFVDKRQDFYFNNIAIDIKMLSIGPYNFILKPYSYYEFNDKEYKSDFKNT